MNSYHFQSKSLSMDKELDIYLDSETQPLYINAGHGGMIQDLTRNMNILQSRGIKYLRFLDLNSLDEKALTSYGSKGFNLYDSYHFGYLLFNQLDLLLKVEERVAEDNGQNILIQKINPKTKQPFLEVSDIGGPDNQK